MPANVNNRPTRRRGSPASSAEDDSSRSVGASTSDDLSPLSSGAMVLSQMEEGVHLLSLGGTVWAYWANFAAELDPQEVVSMPHMVLLDA